MDSFQNSDMVFVIERSGFLYIFPEDDIDFPDCHCYSKNGIERLKKDQKMDNAAGFLTTHILDTARGIPAAQVAIELYRLDGSSRELLASAITNSDGRTDAPILKIGEMETGTYELVFHIGDYFAASAEKPLNAFIDVVPIRFGIDNETSHYHVPLLVSPYSFSTYRGS